MIAMDMCQIRYGQYLGEEIIAGGILLEVPFQWRGGELCSAKVVKLYFKKVEQPTVMKAVVTMLSNNVNTNVTSVHISANTEEAFVSEGEWRIHVGIT